MRGVLGVSDVGPWKWPPGRQSPHLRGVLSAGGPLDPGAGGGACSQGRGLGAGPQGRVHSLGALSWAEAVGGRRVLPGLMSGGEPEERGLSGPEHARGPWASGPQRPHHTWEPRSDGGLESGRRGQWVTGAQPVPRRGDPPCVLRGSNRRGDRQEEAAALTPPLPGLCALWPPAPFPHSVPPGSRRHKGCGRRGPTLFRQGPGATGSRGHRRGLSQASRAGVPTVAQRAPRLGMPARVRGHWQAQHNPPGRHSGGPHRSPQASPQPTGQPSRRTPPLPGMPRVHWSPAWVPALGSWGTWGPGPPWPGTLVLVAHFFRKAPWLA